MTISKQQAALEIARRHPTAYSCVVSHSECQQYTPAWYHYLIGDDLLRVTKTVLGEPVDRPIDRLLIVMPPRSGKTETVTIRFPTWVMSQHRLPVMTLTYGNGLATDFGSKAREVIQSPGYRLLYPDIALRHGSKAKRDWRLTNGVPYRAISLKGDVTGKGCKIMVLDDLYKNQQDADSAIYREWVKDQYAAVAYTRLEPGGAIVACMTRWHHDDFIGWQLREFEEEGWVIRHLPALAMAV